MVKLILMEYAYNKVPERRWSAQARQISPAGETPKARIARARITGVNASYKDLCEVCRNVRGKDTAYAIDFLGEAAKKKKAIYFARNNKGKGHRRELGGKKGGFPIKSVGIVLGVVISAQANATRLGLGDTKIAHIQANKQHSYPRMSPKGRRIRHAYETAFVEVVVEEKQEKIATEKKAEKPVAVVEKKAAEKSTAVAVKKEERIAVPTQAMPAKV